MGFFMFAVMLVVLGGVLRFGAAATPDPGKVRLISYGLFMGGVGLVFLNTVVVIGVGEVGVKRFLGTIDPVPLAAGMHIVNPLATIDRMSVQEQNFPANGGVESLSAQTSEQLNVDFEISIIFTLDAANATDLFERIGTEERIKSQIVQNAVRNGVRDAVATKSINDIFSPNRAELAEDMKIAIQEKAGNRITIVEVFVRDIQAPLLVREAIEEKLQREQQVAAERFQTDIVQERALQQVEEAKGIAEAQIIISEGLTPEYLTFFYIQQLTEMPAGTVVYVPTESGVPLLRTLNRPGGG